jgi:hypothetical protein
MSGLIEKLPVALDYDATKLCAAAGFDGQDQELLAFAATCVQELASGLKAWRVKDPAGEGGGDGFLLLAIAAETEAIFSEMFARSPSRGYLAQALATRLLTRAAATLVPELASHGCAPLVAPPMAVREALASLGVKWMEPGSMSRAWALLTPMPYRGGCEVCLLAVDCPRKTGRL